MTKQRLGVLVLHGFTASLDCVSGVAGPLQLLGIPTRLPVLRGHGSDSPDALRGVTWRDWVTDANAALDDLLLEVEQAVLFGHSMGGLVALTLAADRPAPIDSLVLAAAAVQLATPVAPGRPLGFLAPLLARVLKKWDMPPKYADPALAQFDTNYAWAPLDAAVSLGEFSHVARQRLSKISLPVLILQSRRDSSVLPRSAEIIYRGIATPEAQKRIVWFDQTEHEMFRDCERDATIAAVVDYVQERAALAA